jgi:GH35 family endo-1,4-beta-xylanase
MRSWLMTISAVALLQSALACSDIAAERVPHGPTGSGGSDRHPDSSETTDASESPVDANAAGAGGLDADALDSAPGSEAGDAPPEQEASADVAVVADSAVDTGGDRALDASVKLDAEATVMIDAHADAEGGSRSSDGAADASEGGASVCASAKTLKEAGSCSNRLIGVALSTRHLSEQAYAAAALEFNYVTPEDEMKWDATEPTRNNFTFTAGDTIVDFAVAHGMKVKGHTLVWHNQLPSWLSGLGATDLNSALVAHIKGVMTHYRGKVIAWDVVNEAYDVNGIRDSIWNRALGNAFIETAFRTAREADPNAKLYYNDYDIESAYAKSDAVYAMLKDFKTRGVPVDGVGMQMHTRTTDVDPPLPEFVTNLERFIALGLEVTLSAMDVRFCTGGTSAQQSKRYHDIVAACVAHPGCKDITFWGITDKYSFLNGRTDLECGSGDPPKPLLWDDNYQKKPAYDAVLNALLGR